MLPAQTQTGGAQMPGAGGVGVAGRLGEAAQRHQDLAAGLLGAEPAGRADGQGLLGPPMGVREVAAQPLDLGQDPQRVPERDRRAGAPGEDRGPLRVGVRVVQPVAGAVTLVDAGQDALTEQVGHVVAGAQLLGQRDGLVEAGPCRRPVAAPAEQLAAFGEGHRHAPPVADRAETVDGRPHPGLGGAGVAAVEGGEPLTHAEQSDQPGVRLGESGADGVLADPLATADAGHHRPRHHEERVLRRGVRLDHQRLELGEQPCAPPAVQVAECRGGERDRVLLGQAVRRRPAGRLQHLEAEQRAGAAPPAHAPVGGQRRGQPQRPGRIVAGGPAQGVHDVVVLAVEPLQPGHLIGASQPGLGRRGQLDQVVDVGPPDRLLLTGRRQLLGAEGAHGLQHPEPRAGLDQRLVHQRGEHVLQIVHPADPVRGVQRGAAGEHGQAAGQHPLAGVEQVPAPLDHGPQRAMPRGRGAAAPR
ncbi:hypothetical protein [Actinoplanes aureus]|uniref:hypothetical protein n=1 Tax=Actinoplanes aureus TaxID=2792083 RepID=UPI004038ADCE